MSVTVGTWRRYSWRAVSRPAKPRCQPSIIASENAHAHDVAHVASVRARHGSRCATVGPHSTAATPIRIAGPVPHPTWAFHHPKIGAVPAKLRNRSGVALISGVTMPRCRCGTTNAATTSSAPTGPPPPPCDQRAHPTFAHAHPTFTASNRVCTATRREIACKCGRSRLLMRYADGMSRSRTDKHVTQPSSFSNSEMSTRTGV